jgi:hypothetical protein
MDGGVSYGACANCVNLRDYGRVCAVGLKLYPRDCPEQRPIERVRWHGSEDKVDG